MDVGPDRRIAMAPDRRAVLAIPAAATLLLWPALWNGYPIVFADTGTYLSQAIHRYAGWDRPVFYSLFMLPLHATVTVWPVVVAQALLTVWVLWLVCRALLPWVCGIAFVAGVAVLSAFTWLPWIVCELMPDLFTPLLILVVCLLAWVQDRLSRREQMVLVGMAAFMIASQQSSLPLAFALLAIVFGLRCVAAPHPGTRQKTRTVRWRLVVLPPALAVMGLCTVRQHLSAGSGDLRRSWYGDPAPRLSHGALAPMPVPGRLPANIGRFFVDTGQPVEPCWWP
jgi:hypothetical protein